MSATERRIRVFQVLECGGPGGTGAQVAAICNGLDPERFEVGLVYATRGTDPLAYRAQAKGAVEAHYVPELTRELSPTLDAKALVALVRLFKARRPDVVHAHSSKAGALARLAALAAGVPKVFYSPHGYGFLQRDRSKLARALYRSIERGASLIGEIVAVSESEEALARPLAWGKPVHVVVDPYLGDPSPTLEPHAGLVLGSCGRITAARRPETFLNLAQRVTEHRPNARCVWIGGGDQEGLVRRDIEALGLDGRLEVTGWLDPVEARRRMLGLDVLVHYSAWDALPNAVLEAMACGLPVVGSPAAGDAVVHGETGFIAHSEQELLERTLELLDDPALRRRMGEAGQKTIARRFSPQEGLARLSRLYLSE